MWRRRERCETGSFSSRSRWSAHVHIAQQLYGLFLKRNLTCWLHVVAWSLEDGRGMPSLVSDIYNAGIETMFGLEVIKQSADHKHDTTLSEALEAPLQRRFLRQCLVPVWDLHLMGRNLKRYLLVRPCQYAQHICIRAPHRRPTAADDPRRHPRHTRNGVRVPLGG